MDKVIPKEVAVPSKSNVLEQKNAANLKRTLGQTIQAFEKNKEWADYGHWLQKVMKCLEDYPSYNIPEKLTFGKRLAQCLNPTLPPSIHINTIQVYSLIFRIMKDTGFNWCEDLGLYSIGIFPLFQYAASQVKPKILSLYRDHYFPLGKQLIPCVAGLTISILPGVEEPNEAMQKDVFNTLDLLGNAVTRKYFIGAVWMAILRNSKVRLSGIKYLSKRLKRTYIDPEENEGAQEGDDTESEPEEISPVKKARDSEGSQEEGEEEEEVEEVEEGEEEVVEEADQSPTKEEAKEETTVITMEDQNKFFRYLPTAEDEAFLRSLDQENEDDINIEYPNKSSLVINALIAGMEDENNNVQKVCLDFMATHFKLAADLFSEKEKYILIEAALNLLIRKDQQILRRVYTWIFGPADMENKYQITEKNEIVLEYLITAFKKLFSRVPKDAFQATLPLKVLQNFYMEHDHLVEQTLPHLSLYFLQYVYKYSQPGRDFAEEVQKAGARFMENITSYFATLLTSLSETLDVGINEQDNEKCLEIINLIEFTFRLESSIVNKEENINYLEQKNYLKAIISGILRSVSSVSPDQSNLASFIETALTLNLNLIDKLEKVERDLIDIIREKNLTEEEIQQIMAPGQADYGFRETLDRYNVFYERTVDQILAFHHESLISQKTLNLFAAASETIVKIQTFQDDTTLTQLPFWVQSVLQCIRSNFPAVSIIGIRTMQSLLVSSSEKPIFEIIRNLITQTEENRGNDDIVRRTTEKLWVLLDVHYLQNPVSDLLLVFQAHFPQIFAETVSNSFDVPSITAKEAAIRRFGSFWKMASDMAKSDFIESGIGLLAMLEFLDHDNPLLRHSSKSWLLDAIPYLYRIIDPIFEILMQTKKNTDRHLRLYATDTKQYFFTEVYDTDIVQDSFRKLRSILITSNELFVRYVISIKVSERLRQHRPFFLENDLSIDEPCTYLDLLVTVCLRYIQGHAIEALSPKFQNQNASVNASASEFMELLITHIENKELSAHITHFIMEPTLTVLHHAINNLDYVLQVQLLNLLKVILYQSSYCNYEPTRYKCVALLSSSKFVQNLLRGLHVEQQYVRVQYINFIGMCMSVLTENLHQPDVLKDNVMLILRAYFDIILSKNLQVAENNDEFEPWESDNISFEDDLKSRKLDMVAGEEGKQPEEKAKARPFTIKSQSQNEIYILLEGVKKILDYFLKFNTIPEKEQGTIFHGAEGPGVFTVVKDIFTLGFLQKGAAEEKKDLASTAHNDTTQAILKDLLRVIYILIYCWRLSKEFRTSADFTSMGIAPYTFERYNDINKMVKDNHMRIDPHAKTVKSLIISILKPLTYQYTNETVNGFLNYWIRECQKQQDLRMNPRLMKEIEILVSMNVSTEMIITALSKNQIVIDINREYQEEMKRNKKGPAVLSYNAAKTEAHIFFLLYTYISYAFIDISFLKKEYLIKLWTTALNFTKLFTISKSISTHLWLIELLNLLALKYNPKEILGDNKIKKEMHAQINALLVQIANTSAKNVVIYFNRPGSGADVPKFRTVAPFSPTIYSIYKSYVSNESKVHSLPGSQNELGENVEVDAGQENFKIEKLMFRNFEDDVSEQSLYDRYRLFGLKTLKQVGLPVLQNSYSPERIDRVIVRTKEFMVIVFPLIENKSPENRHFAECASELLYYQLEDSRSFLVKDYKKNILDIFNGDDFFKCSKQTLKYWSKIIDWVVTMDRGDLFSEFMTKWANAFSFFYSQASGEKQKIKAFERICFIIYSGEKDKYQDKLFLLLEKMGEIIKNADETNPALVILVLFSMRILILRLSPSSLNELFRHIWPILLTLLMQIFKKGKIPKNPNLILATLKLIEMMSIVQLEEFFINQWVFIFDYFGLKIDPVSGDFMNASTGTLMNQATQQEGEENKGPKISGFVYQPYITNVVQPDLKIDYRPRQIYVQEDYEKVERKIIVTQTHVRGEAEIQEQALNLIQYLIQQNEFRTQVDPNEVENLIEGDFISFDDYIFDIRDPVKL